MNMAYWPLSPAYSSSDLSPNRFPELSRAEFLDEVRAGPVRKIEIEDQEVILSESTTRVCFRSGFDKNRDAQLADSAIHAPAPVQFGVMNEVGRLP
jgi:hypothetical protein